MPVTIALVIRKGRVQYRCENILMSSIYTYIYSFIVAWLRGLGLYVDK